MMTGSAVQDTPFPLPDGLNDAETRLVAAAARGEMLTLDPDASVADRTIRPAVIEALMRGHATRLTSRGLRVQWAVVDGVLDLSAVGSEETPAPPLVLWGANVLAEGEAAVNLRLDIGGAALAELDLRGSRLTQIAAADLVVRRRCVLTRLLATEGLNFDSAQIGSHAILDGLAVQGEARFAGAKIGGQFIARAGASMIGVNGQALVCDRMSVGGNVFLDGANIAGEVRFCDAEIGGQFSARAGTTISRVDGYALNCDGISVTGAVFLDGSTIAGEVRFLGAQIGGQFNASAGVTISCANGYALNCDGMLVEGDVFLNGATITGTVRFLGAEIGGQLTCLAGTTISRPNGQALNFYTAVVRGGVFLRGTVITGATQFSEAEIGRAFDLGSATLGRMNGQGMRISGDLRLFRFEDGEPTVLSGPLRLERTVIDGALLLHATVLKPDPNDREQIALSLEHARIGARLEVQALPPETRGVIDLRGLRTGLLDDGGGRGWGELCHAGEPQCVGERIQGVQLRLDGFTYDRLAEFEDRKGMDPTIARQHRHAFLMRQFCGAKPGRDDYTPQPFDQVIKIARTAGHPREADWFAREKQEFRRRCGVDGWLGNVWSRFTGLCFGHYYSPGRAFATLAAAIVLGMALLIAANQRPNPPREDDPARQAMLLAQRRVQVALPPEQAAGAGQGEYAAQACWKQSEFWTIGRVSLPKPAVLADVALTAFDRLLPVVELKADDRCEVNDAAAGHAWWNAVFALYSVLGLVILPMFLATVTGLLKREGSS